MKKVIVTGGLGFIGSNLIKILLKKKYYVINLDKITYSSNFYNVKEFSKSINYKFIKVDINNKKKILQILKKFKPNAIFNLAAETHVDRSIDQPETFIKSNILGVFNLLEAFKMYLKKNKKIKLIHISTDEVYGDILNGRSKEDDAYKPSSPYAASKASSDHLVYSYIRTFKIPAIITNCSNNYGPWQYPEKLIPLVIANALQNKPLPIYGDGKNIRDWIYVDDNISALWQIINKGKIGQTYNIGSNHEISNLDLVKKICSLLDIYIPKNKPHSRLINFVKDRLGHDFRYSINSKKIRNQLNFKPKYNLNNGLDLTVKFYLKNSKWLIKKSTKIK